jgi:hypothetical protein
MPSENHLLAKKPAAGGGLPDGANLERLENKDQVNTSTEDGYTLNCGRDKVASVITVVGALVRGLVIGGLV